MVGLYPLEVTNDMNQLLLVMRLYISVLLKSCIIKLSSSLEVKFLSSSSIRMQSISKYAAIQYMVKLYCNSKWFKFIIV